MNESVVLDISAGGGTAVVGGFDGSLLPEMSLTGNGFKDYNALGNSTPTPYVLGANTDYYLQLSLRSQILAPDFSRISPPLVATSEFGGALSAGVFNGVDVQVHYTLLPEPSAVALAGIGALGLLICEVRRRLSTRC